MTSLRTRLLAASAGVLMGLAAMLPGAAYAAGSATVQALSPGATVSVGSPVTFQVSTSGFSNPYYTLSDGFGGTSITGGNIDANGNFSWTPQSGDVGTHDLNISVNDSQSDYATLQQEIVVMPPLSLSVQNLSASTVNPGQALSFNTSAVGFSGTPTYSVTDSLSGSTITSGDVNSSGTLSWTPQSQDAGTHTITVTATDSSGRTASATQQVTVSSVPTVVASIASTTVMVGSPVSFTATASGFSNPVIFSASDYFGGNSSTLSNADINSSGSFSWTPAASDVGSHSITITGYDATAGATATVVIPVTVTSTSTSAVAASGLTQVQISAIISLVESFGLDQAAVNNVSAALNGQAFTAATPSASAGDGYVFSNFLDVGSTGTDVTELQNRLTTLGVYSGPVTGYFGPLTQAAVEQFQASHGIEQVGYVGPSTRAALNQ